MLSSKQAICTFLKFEFEIIFKNMLTIALHVFRDVDEYCLKQNKWGGLKERLAEQQRIFASIREEHVEIVQRLDESRNELDDLERKIPLKSRCFLNQNI